MGCFWTQIDGFESPDQYRRFLDWLNTLINSGEVEEVPAYARFKAFQPRWFRQVKSGEIWAHMPPDGPSHGYWGKPWEGDDIEKARNAPPLPKRKISWPDAP